jgi:hypothetical protein
MLTQQYRRMFSAVRAGDWSTSLHDEDDGKTTHQTGQLLRCTNKGSAMSRIRIENQLYCRSESVVSKRSSKVVGQD